MKGYLYVEEDLLGKANNTYVKRYFISYKFCGLKWFTKEPTDIKNDAYLQCISNNTCGWVYGGNIIVQSVEADKEIKLKETTIYSFIITLQCSDYITKIRFATKTNELRKKWMDEINLSMKVLTYLSCCSENNILPSQTIWNALENDTVSDTLYINKGPIDNKHFNTILKYYNIITPHGLMLNSIILENIQLVDNNIPYLCNILEISPYISILSIANNRITSTGIKQLCQTLIKLQYITHLNISNNYINDNSTDILTKTISKLYELKYLNISYNYYTEESVDLFILRIATYKSKLKYINFSYNNFGNKIINFIILLCNIKPSLIEYININYCNINDIINTDFYNSIENCNSLKYFSLLGNIINNKNFELIIKLQCNIHNKQKNIINTNNTTTNNQYLTINYGGIQQYCNNSIYYNIKILKNSLLNVSDIASIRSIILRRKILYKNILQHEKNIINIINPINKLQIELENYAEYSYPIVQIKVQLTNYYNNCYELIESLCLYLKCDIGQIYIISITKTDTMNSFTTNTTTSTTNASTTASTTTTPTTTSNSSNNKYISDNDIYVIVFTILNCPLNRQTVKRNNSYINTSLQLYTTVSQQILNTIDNNINNTDNSNNTTNNNNISSLELVESKLDTLKNLTITEKLLNNKTEDIFNTDKEEKQEQILYQNANFQTVDYILYNLLDLARKSHPIMRCLGIHEMKVEYTNPDYLNNISDIEYKSEHILIQPYINTNSKNDLNNEYIPILYPHILTQTESNSRFNPFSEDTDDDDTFDTIVRTIPNPNITTSSITTNNTTNTTTTKKNKKSTTSSSNKHKHINSTTLKKIKKATIISKQQQHIDTTTTNTTDTTSTTNITNNTQNLQDTDILDPDLQYIIASEEYMLNTIKIRQKRIINEKIITAIKQLYSEKEINSYIAKFWEGALGNLKYKTVTQMGLKQVLHTDSGVFIGIYLKQCLYDAMLHRNINEMNYLIGKFRLYGFYYVVSVIIMGFIMLLI